MSQLYLEIAYGGSICTIEISKPYKSELDYCFVDCLDQLWFWPPSTPSLGYLIITGNISVCHNGGGQGRGDLSSGQSYLMDRG